jgi:hypothetical protein
MTESRRGFHADLAVLFLFNSKLADFLFRKSFFGFFIAKDPVPEPSTHPSPEG